MSLTNGHNAAVAVALLTTLLPSSISIGCAEVPDRQAVSSTEPGDRLLAGIVEEAPQHLQVNWSTRLPIVRQTLAERLPDAPRPAMRIPLPGNDEAHGPFLQHTGDRLARKATRFTTHYDHEALYVVVACVEPDPSAPLQIGHPHPGDRVGIWLDHDLDHRTFYNLWVMPDGRIQEQRRVVRQRGLERWEMGVTG